MLSTHQQRMPLTKTSLAAAINTSWVVHVTIFSALGIIKSAHRWTNSIAFNVCQYKLLCYPVALHGSQVPKHQCSWAFLVTRRAVYPSISKGVPLETAELGKSDLSLHSGDCIANSVSGESASRVLASWTRAARARVKPSRR